jgi:hypothetical protein
VMIPARNVRRYWRNVAAFMGLEVMSGKAPYASLLGTASG